MTDILEAIGHGLIEILPGYQLRPPQMIPGSYTDGSFHDGPQIQLWNPKPNEPTIHMHLCELKDLGPTLEANWRKRYNPLGITSVWSLPLAHPDSIDGLIRALRRDGFPIQEPAQPNSKVTATAKASEPVPILGGIFKI